MNTEQITQETVRKAGWIIGTFGQAKKWYNPSQKDGSHYCVESKNALRYIVEDHPEQFK